MSGSRGAVEVSRLVMPMTPKDVCLIVSSYANSPSQTAWDGLESPSLILDDAAATLSKARPVSPGTTVPIDHQWGQAVHSRVAGG